MALETVTHISDFITTNPTPTDQKSQGDDHIRNVKLGIKNTFPQVTGPVAANQTELNYVAGVTSAIQTQINGKANVVSPSFSGIPTAPTAPIGTGSTQIATTAFAQLVAFYSGAPSAIDNPLIQYGINTGLRAAAYTL